jgi:hypothetical protein
MGWGQGDVPLEDLSGEVMFGGGLPNDRPRVGRYSLNRLWLLPWPCSGDNAVEADRAVPVID